jgi:hypothetical protein
MAMKIRDLLPEMEKLPSLRFARDAEDDQNSAGPNRDEFNRIVQDKYLKKRPRARAMLFTVMPGNDSTYGAF